MRISDWSSDVCSSDLEVAALTCMSFRTKMIATTGMMRRTVTRVTPIPRWSQFMLTEMALYGSGFTTRVITRSEEHTSELQSLMRISYAVFCLKNKNNNIMHTQNTYRKQTDNHPTI